MSTIIGWIVCLGLGAVVVAHTFVRMGTRHDKRQDRILQDRYRVRRDS